MTDRRLTLAARLLLNAEGWTRGTRQARRDTEGFTKHSARHLTRLQQAGGRSLVMLGRGVDRVGNRYTALIGGAMGVGAARGVATFERRLTRLGIQADISSDQVNGLKQRLFETANQPDVRIDPADLLGGIEAIVEKTGDLQFAEDNLRNIALAMQATGASGSAIGEIAAEFQKMNLREAREVLETLDILTVQGKAGAFTLENLAALGPRVVTAYTQFGRVGKPAIREMGAMLQVIRQGVGSSEEAATSFERLLDTFNQPDKIRMIERGLRVPVFEDVDGERRLRAINELVQDIVVAADGDTLKLSRIFDTRAARAMRSMIGEYKQMGEITGIKSFYNVQADGSVITADSTRAANDFTAATESMRNAWRKFSNENLASGLQTAADALNSVDQDTVQRWLNVAKWVGVTFGAIWAARKLFKAGSAVAAGARTIFGGSRSGAGGGFGGGAMGGGRGPIPVYVVNRHLSMLPGSWSGGGSGAPPSGPAKGAQTGSAMRTAARWGAGATIAGAAGYGVGTLINNRFVSGTAFSDYLGAGIAHTLGFLGNQTARDAVDSTREAQHHLRIEIDSEGRARVRDLRADKGMEIDVFNGPLAVAQ